MGKDTDLDVGYVARLARIALTEEERKLFQEQLSEVLKHADKLRAIDVSEVEATAHAIPIVNVFRDDEARDWLTPEEALSNAPQKSNGLFRVPKVVE